jgi:hypothetical protein
MPGEMTMKRFGLFFMIMFWAAGGAACNPINSQALTAQTSPHSWIDAPLDGVVRPPNPCAVLGASCEVISHSTDPLHIVQVELSVNGQVVQTLPNPDPSQSLVLTKQQWLPPGPGNYTLRVRAQNSAGVWGEYAQAIVTVGSTALGGIVRGVVYADLNGNGKIEGSEGALDGVTVSISGCGSGTSQTTGADGKFEFSNLPASNPPAGMCLVSVAKSGWVYSGSFPALGLYPVPAVSDPSKPTAFSIFMTHVPGIVPAVIPTATPSPAPLPPVTLAFTADATTLTRGQCTTIRWQVTNASQVVLDNATVNPNGSKQDCPTQTTTHTLRVVTLDKQNVQRTLTITVNAAIPTRTVPPPPPPASCNGTPVISSFSASPLSIPLGGSSTLSWGTVSNADSVEIDNGIGGVPAPGSRSVAPSVTTVYVLTARCKGTSALARTRVTVVQPPTPTPTLFILRLLPTPTHTPIIVR